MEMTDDRWRYLSAYSREVFGVEDAHLAGLMVEAVAQDMPDIAVGPDVGRLLMILTSMTRGRLAVEVGTLAGYSGIWIARGLAPGGRLITIEAEDRHADFAERQFARAGVADRVQVRRAKGIDELRRLSAELSPGAVDVLFLDAIKAEYPDYWALGRPLVAEGGLVIADNVYGTSWWIGDETSPERNAVDRFNRAVAADPDFECVAVPMRSGVLIGRRRD